MIMAFMVLAQLLQMIPNYCYVVSKSDEKMKECDQKNWNFLSAFFFSIVMLIAPLQMAFGIFQK